MSQRWIVNGEQSGLQMHIAATFFSALAMYDRVGSSAQREAQRQAQGEQEQRELENLVERHSFAIGIYVLPACSRTWAAALYGSPVASYALAGNRMKLPCLVDAGVKVTRCACAMLCSRRKWP